ncbi:Alpha/Beta hydrolase protein [Ilyonectria destructans]|nr:Alpha/Beta hydrolase protein [Ilyonectria destructans]
MALSRFRLSATRPSLWGSHDSTSLSLAWSSNAAVARARHVRSCRRGFHVAPILIPPLMFGGLFVALWTWKCAMMVLCQNMIIYNPFLPPNARSMRIADYAKDCGGIQWREERIRSLDGTEIALCVSDVLPASDPGIVGRTKTPVYILYFQGNASSLPPRLPDLSWILHRVRDADDSATYTMVCVSYRGYWTSHDRPYERGINKDSEAALQWISQLHEARSAGTDQKPVVLLWGQSIGCGFATNLAAKGQSYPGFKLDALILETPFLSVRTMLHALYPQKWLPYQYLYPFLWNHLDSWTNLGVIAQRYRGRLPGVYMVEAGKDELVPAHHGAGLYQRCEDVGLPVERRKVRGALHNEAMVRAEGKNAIAQSILLAVTRAQAAGLSPGSDSDGKSAGHGLS